jgi:enolase-phosphatase E1
MTSPAGEPRAPEKAETRVPRAVLTDIEGTTTAAAMVKDVLFPYARRMLPDFVRRHGDAARVKSLLDDVRRTEGASLDDDAVVRVLIRWIDEDRKATPLKELQGLIWSDGYRSGELHGHVYLDAVERLRAWQKEGIALYVYSSGSVLAQKLLFGHTPFGDLTGLFSGFFDTTTGKKVDPESYVAIARAIGRPPGSILFLSDSPGELDAARVARLATRWVDRDGSGGSSGHARVSSFSDILLHD